MTRRYKMKKIIIALLVFALAPYSLTFAAKTKYKVFKPSGGKSYEFVKSGEKKYKYFVTEENAPLYFKVTGPTKLKIRTRPALDQGKSSQFEIQVWEGDKLVKGRRVKSNASELTLDKTGEKIGLSRDIFINVPKGKHNYTLRINSKTSTKFYTRFHQSAKKKKKAKYSVYRPYDFEKKISLKSAKYKTTYYIVDNDGGAKIKAVGPTEVIIYCRANFNETMKEKSKFAIGVFENGNEVKKFTGIANKSKKLVYEERTDYIPSTLHKYKLSVPSGQHEYEIKKVNSAAPSLSVRFKMNNNSLGKKK